jgi:RNA polymerase sigma factor (sigma-70 family)
MYSVERFDEDGITLESLLFGCEESAEDLAIRKILKSQVRAAFMSLESDERNLLQALILDGMTEREYADVIGLSQKGVNKRKKKILAKLKNLVLKAIGNREGY